MKEQYIKFLTELAEGATDIVKMLREGSETENVKWKSIQTAPASKVFDEEKQIVACVMEYRHVSDSVSTRRRNTKLNVIQVIWWDQFLEGGNWVNQKGEICFPNIWCLEVKDS